MDFGPKSPHAKEGIKLLLKKIQALKNSILKSAFGGEGYIPNHLFAKGSLETDLTQKIAEAYEIDPLTSQGEFIFAVHSYIAILIKLITYQMVAIYQNDPNQSFEKLAESISSDLKTYFTLLEQGEIFQRHGIENFLENVEIFSWYLQAWDEELVTWLRGCIRGLAVYSFKYNCYKDHTEDLFKNLYQALLMRSLRRVLGEVFTPSWLAEFIVNDCGYEGNLAAHILDPTCGSGTFLLQVIKKIRRYYEERKQPLEVTVFQQSVIGFDLNPLAVLAARSNFLGAILDILEPNVPFIIPIHLINCIEMDQRFSNSVVPSLQNYFDFVVGNPPWINWEIISEPFKKTANELWSRYGLFPSKGWKGKLGYAKYDISAVFVYRSMEFFLKPGGILEFLVPEALIRGIPGRGFRRYEILQKETAKSSIKLGLKKIHDLTRFQPFRDVNTRTVIIQLRRNEETVYPIPYLEWEKLEKPFLATQWKEGKSAFKFKKKVAAPVTKDDLLSRLLVADTEDELLGLQIRVFKASDYKASEGANTEGLNCAFWINNLKIEKTGRISFQQVLNRVKKKVIARKLIPIEPFLIYPLIRSGDINRWCYKPQVFIIFTPKYDKNIINQDSFRNQFPATYEYLEANFRQELLSRKSFKKKSAKYPFYILFGSDIMKSSYKVCWNRMGHRINAAVIEEYDDPKLGRKAPIPQETIIFISTDSLDEAHYLCAILNSDIFTELLNMVSMKGGKGYASSNILEVICIPKFDIKDIVHSKLVNASKKAHFLVQNEYMVSDIEDEINYLTKKVFAGD